jgi:hypothetical protein
MPRRGGRPQFRAPALPDATSCWASSSQTLRPASSASASLSRCLRQMDQISGGVPLDECVPGLLLAMSGPGRQVNYHRTARRVSAGRRKGTGATAGVPAARVLRGKMRDCSRRPCWVGLCYGSACPGSHDLVLLAARNRQGTLRHALATETGRLIVAWTGPAMIWPPTPGGLARRARRGVVSACRRISRSPR